MGESKISQESAQPTELQRSRPMIPVGAVPPCPPNYRLSRCQALYRTNPIDIRSWAAWVDFLPFLPRDVTRQPNLQQKRQNQVK